jgi:hypothetical protein
LFPARQQREQHRYDWLGTGAVTAVPDKPAYAAVSQEPSLLTPLALCPKYISQPVMSRRRITPAFNYAKRCRRSISICSVLALFQFVVLPGRRLGSDTRALIGPLAAVLSVRSGPAHGTSRSATRGPAFVCARLILIVGS